MIAQAKTVCQVELEPLEQAQVLVLIENAKQRGPEYIPTANEVLKEALTLGLRNMMGAMVHDDSLRYIIDG